jgi:hypothetical protein
VVKTSDAGQADHLGTIRRPFLDAATFRGVSNRRVDTLAVVVVDVT